MGAPSRGAPPLMLRAVLEILVALLLISFLRSILGALAKGFSGYLGQNPAAKRGPELRNAGELKRDPVCGTYVSTATSVKRVVRGETIHFCSPECSAKYRNK
jgi:YHS domain-containing protein